MNRSTLFLILAAIALVAAACSAAAEPAEIETTATTTTIVAATTTFAPLLETTTTAGTTTEATTTTVAEAAEEDAPELTTTPADGDVVDTYVVQFIGGTTPGADVEVDGEAVIVDRGGSFSVPIRSQVGSNEVSIVATNASGGEMTAEIEYTFEPPEGWVTGIGDSVMLGAADELESRFGDGIVDADVSRQFRGTPGLIRDLVAAGDPAQVVIVHLGTNGEVDDALFDRTMLEAAEVPLVVFVNVRVPRDWETPTNAALAAGVERWDNAILVDWFGASDEDDGNFAGDGFHPSLSGRVLYADLITEAIFPSEAAVDS